MSNSLDGQVALVTGADSGIGRAVARELAGAGANIAIVYLHDTEGADASARDVAAAGRRAHTAQVDVRDQRGVADLFDIVSDGWVCPHPGQLRRYRGGRDSGGGNHRR